MLLEFRYIVCALKWCSFLVQRNRHHGPRAFPHPAPSQTQSLLVNVGWCVEFLFSEYCLIINALIQVREAFVFLYYAARLNSVSFAKFLMYNHGCVDTVEWNAAASGPKASHFEFRGMFSKKASEPEYGKHTSGCNTFIPTRYRGSMSPFGRMLVVRSHNSSSHYIANFLGHQSG